MSLAALRDVYNPLAIKPEAKPPLKDWTESVPVVLLSEALKIVGKKHGISLGLADDGRLVLSFNPGMNAAERGSERWCVAEQVIEYFIKAADDLIELLLLKKIQIPAQQRRTQWNSKQQ